MPSGSGLSRGSWSHKQNGLNEKHELNEKQMNHDSHRAKRPLRVIFLSITFAPEPGALRGLPLARWLRDRGGYDIKVLTAVPWYPLGRVYPGYRQKLWQWEEMDGISVLRVPIFPSHDQSALRRILTYLSFMCSAALIGVWKIGKADIVYYFDNLPTTGAVAWLISGACVAMSGSLSTASCVVIAPIVIASLSSVAPRRFVIAPRSTSSCGYDSRNRSTGISKRQNRNS